MPKVKIELTDDEWRYLFLHAENAFAAMDKEGGMDADAQEFLGQVKASLFKAEKQLET